MQEKFYNVLALATALYVSYNYVLAADELLLHWTVLGLILMETLMLFFCTKNINHFSESSPNFRPGTSSGVFLALAIPLTQMGELIALHRNGVSEARMAQLWLSLASVLPLVARCLWISREANTLCLVLMILSSGIIVLNLSLPMAFCLAVVDLMVFWKGLNYIPELLPKSFTYGEMALVLQLLILFINRFVFGWQEASWLLGENYSLVLFIHTLLATVIVATLAVYLTSAQNSLYKFMLVYSLFGMAALGFLHLTLPEMPILWLLHFIMDGCNRVFLLVIWFLLFAITLTWTANQSLVINQVREVKNEAHSDQQEASTSADSRPDTAKFIARKMFHVFIVLVYIPGLMIDPRFLLLASTAVLGLFIIVEAARSLQVPVIGDYINDVQKLFVDDRDQGCVFLTHIYLLVGMSLPLWMSPHLLSSSIHRASPEMYAGVLALGVGDTVACLAGRTFGKMHWFESKKTVEGTMCSIAAQMILVVTGSLSGVVTITSMSTVLTGVTLAALAEAFTDQIDNLLLPLVLYPILCFS